MPLYLALAAVFLLSLSWYRIFEKAGYGGWIGLLALIPGVNLLMMTILAFSDWPVLVELRQLRQRLGGES
ncbi:MAG: hypothetical protein EXR55_02365 [Dehalococcoidia bacterium]|nr:hypothetical protein [Dehalococcoidia bacterium]